MLTVAGASVRRRRVRVCAGQMTVAMDHNRTDMLKLMLQARHKAFP